MAASVLIIDDDERLNNMLAERLGAAGYRVLQEFRGSRGVNTAIRKKPAVVLLDIKTADVQGLEVLQRLRAKRVPTRVIIYTGESKSEADIIQFGRAGAASYILKNDNTDAVVDAIERALALDSPLDSQARASVDHELASKIDDLQAENEELKRSLARRHLFDIGSRAFQAGLVIAVLGSFRYLDIVTLEGASGLTVVGVVFAALFLPVDRLVRLTVSAFGNRARVDMHSRREDPLDEAA
jgi:DNA-binding NarL/FixJ family response regulator